MSDEAVPTREQIPVVLAFQRIVRTQRTSDGKIWYPTRILEELWTLWRERPKSKDRHDEFSRKRDFLAEHHQRISRIRRGVTKGATYDGLIYTLIERFVHKHAEPGDYTPLARDITAITAAAETLCRFATPAGMVAARSTLNDVLLPSRALDAIAVFRLRDLHVANPNTPRPPWEESAFAQEGYLPEKYLAVGRLSAASERFLPALLFDQEFAYLELGFFLDPLSAAFLRTVTGRPFGIAVARSGRAEIPSNLVTNAHLLDFRFFGRGRDQKTIVYEKDAVSGGNETQHFKYDAAIVRDKELTRFAERVLAFFS